MKTGTSKVKVPTEPVLVRALFLARRRPFSLGAHKLFLVPAHGGRGKGEGRRGKEREGKRERQAL